MSTSLITFPRSTKNSIEDTSLRQGIQMPKIGASRLGRPRLGQMRVKSNKLGKLKLSLFGGKL